MAPARKAIGLAKGGEAMDAICIGYPKILYQRIPLRNEPRITWREREVSDSAPAEYLPFVAALLS